MQISLPSSVSRHIQLKYSVLVVKNGETDTETMSWQRDKRICATSLPRSYSLWNMRLPFDYCRAVTHVMWAQLEIWVNEIVGSWKLDCSSIEGGICKRSVMNHHGLSTMAGDFFHYLKTCFFNKSFRFLGWRCFLIM